MRYWRLCILCLLLISCGETDSGIRILNEKPSLVGNIQSINPMSGKIDIIIPNPGNADRKLEADTLLTMHVQDINDPIDQNMNVIVTNRTKIYYQQDEKYIKKTTNDLHDQVYINVFFIGSISASYPATGIADQIFIINK